VTATAIACACNGTPELHEDNVQIVLDFHEFGNIIVLLLHHVLSTIFATAKRLVNGSPEPAPGRYA
jgi:hypothetical protein